MTLYDPAAGAQPSPVDALQRALEERDPAAAAALARTIDEDAASAAVLLPLLDDALATQPDALYAFIRARLGAADGDDPAAGEWLRRLREAAHAALDVAIQEGDADTLLDWLQLIAREPPHYGLYDVLHQGILHASGRACQEPKLAQGVLHLAIKRDPAGAQVMLDNDDLTACLSADQQTPLLALMLKEKRDDLALQFLRRFVPAAETGSLLAAGFLRSGRPTLDLIGLVGALSAGGQVSQQMSLDIYLAVLEANEWQHDTLPITSQVARLIQVPGLHVNGLVPWKLLETAQATHDELSARGAARRIQMQIEASRDDETLADLLEQLVAHAAWSTQTMQSIETWWRAFASTRTSAQLGRLQKLMDPHRSLAPLRTISHSILSVRRMFGKRTMREFVDAVSMTHDMLQTLSEAYDPPARRSVSFDVQALREEMERHFAEVPPEYVRLLANQLKALASLITDMADERTKTSLIRRSDDVDHQLARGDLAPHSAVDALKWIAGYLEGAQDAET
jgi:hypothetical protein